MENSRILKILITNDDGIQSESMLSFAKSLLDIATITVVAPDRERSGVSQAFTCSNGLKLERFSNYDFPCYSLSGTPADCVKLAISESLCDGVPDLVLSGVNWGENAGVSSVYSGTVAGAREAALWGIPAIAFSLSERNNNKLLEVIALAKKIIQENLFKEMPKGVFWNVNFPRDSVPFAGVAVTSMGTGMFSDHYVFKDSKYFLEGEKDYENAEKHSDDYALSKGFAVITPLQVDQTSTQELNRLQQIDFNLAIKG